MVTRREPILFIVLFAFVASCAHRGTVLRSDADSAALRAALSEVCGVGRSVRSASGTAWIQARSPERSGRFPAHVRAKSGATGTRLDLEVNNPFGGVEARVSVESKDRVGMVCEIRVPGEPLRTEGERGAWSGIPLRWAATLFLGQVPCPLKPEEVRRGNDSELVVDSSEGRFAYRLREVEGRPWPEVLVWKSGESEALEVSFAFHAPEPGSRSPTRFLIKGPQGEVSARWQQRETTRN